MQNTNPMLAALAARGKLSKEATLMPEREHIVTILAAAFACLHPSVLSGPQYKGRSSLWKQVPEGTLQWPIPYDFVEEYFLGKGPVTLTFAAFKVPCRCLSCNSWSVGITPTSFHCQKCIALSIENIVGQEAIPYEPWPTAVSASNLCNMYYNSLSLHWQRVFISEYGQWWEKLSNGESYGK